jgi:nuclear pore complex protein Nup155
MAFQTPQRPLPGAFFNTPAASRFGPPPPQPLFRQAPTPAQPQQNSAPQQQQQPQPAQLQALPQNRQLEPIQRAARTINDVLQKEANFPDLDSYVRRK